MNEETKPDETTDRQDTEATDSALEDNGQQDGPEVVGEVVETRDEEMERLRGAAAEAEKRVLMAQAEAENFRKRMRRDFEDQLKFAALPLVADLLEVRDNLLRALEASETTEDASGLSEGVAMVAKQLDDTLAKYAIREIPAQDELFDPNFHEAISHVPDETHAPGTVAHVAQTGFQMHDRVVRPSQVVVSSGPADS